MRTVGEILSEKRRLLGLSFDEIEKETKIRTKYLEAIEKNNFSSIAESTVVKGLVRNYSQALGLSPDGILAVFRRDFQEDEKGQIIPRGMVKPLVEKRFYWTPKLTFLFLVFISIVGFVFFFARQFWRFSSAPSLEIFLPREGEVVKERVEISGKVDKDSTLKIDSTLISIAEDGTFKEEIVLPQGENVITIEATNRQGKKKIINRKVKVE